MDDWVFLTVEVMRERDDLHGSCQGHVFTLHWLLVNISLFPFAFIFKLMPMAHRLAGKLSFYHSSLFVNVYELLMLWLLGGD